VSNILLKVGLAVDKDVNAMFMAESQKAAAEAAVKSVEAAAAAGTKAQASAFAKAEKALDASLKRREQREMAAVNERIARENAVFTRGHAATKTRYQQELSDFDAHLKALKAKEVAAQKKVGPAVAAVATSIKQFEKGKASQVAAQSKAHAGLVSDKIKHDNEMHAARQRAAKAELSDFDARLNAHKQFAAHKLAAEKEAARAARTAEKEASRAGKASSRESNAFRRQVGSGLMRGLSIGAGMAGLSGMAGLASKPFEMASGILGGMGADFSFAGAAGRAMQQERGAANLSNAGYVASDANNNSRVAPATLLKEARDAANAFGESTDSALDGMTRFVKKTGDLATIRPIFMELAGLSKAYGADLGDMADAAADVALQLKDVEDKGPAIISIMRTIAMQGKLGAVEISDLASQLAKVVAGSKIFANAEGKGTTGTIKQMTGFAQLARTQNASPQQAATAVGAFINAYSKNSRRAGMASILGIPESQLRDKDGKFMDPVVMLGKLLGKVKGDWTKLSPAFGDAKSMAVVKGAAGMYTSKVEALRASGEAAKMTPEQLNAAGVQAYIDGMNRQTRAMETDAALRESLNKVTSDSMSVVQRYNNKMDELGGKMGAALLPMLEGLVGPATRLAMAFNGMVDFLTNAGLLGKVSKATELNAQALDAEVALRNARDSTTATPAEIMAATKTAESARAALASSLPSLASKANPNRPYANAAEGAYDLLDRAWTAIQNQRSDMQALEAGKGPEEIRGMSRVGTSRSVETAVAQQSLKWSEEALKALTQSIANAGPGIARALEDATRRELRMPKAGDGTSPGLATHTTDH
jgi:hypothetical protein